MLITANIQLNINKLKKFKVNSATNRMNYYIIAKKTTF